MKRMILATALLTAGVAEGLTATQREQHVNQVFSAAGIRMIDCPSIASASMTRYCGYYQYSDDLLMRSWDLYSNWSSKVSVVANHATAWKLSDTGKSYSAVFEAKDGDEYLVTVSAGSSDTPVIVTWLSGGSQMNTPSGSSSTASGSSVPSISSECDPGAVKVASIQGSGWVYSEWVQPAAFPNPSVKKSNGGAGKSISISCNNFKLNYNTSTGEYIFSGKSFDDMVNHSGISRYKQLSSIDLLDNSMSGDLATFGITFDPSIKKLKALGEKNEIFNGVSIGYRIDGGTLMPLFFEGKNYDLAIPDNAGTVEIYAMPSKHTAWQYFKLNMKSGELVLKASNPFPSK